MDSAGELDCILCIFSRIGQEVADELGHGLAVYVRTEVFRRIFHDEAGTVVCYCRLEALADLPHQRSQRLAEETHLHGVLLDLSEIEKLVDKIKEPLAVVVDDIEVITNGFRDLIDLLHHLFKRSDDKRYRSPDLMGDHGKELDLRLEYLLFLLGVEFLHLIDVLPFVTTHKEREYRNDSHHAEDSVHHLESSGEEDMRMDYDLKLRRFFIPYRIAVAGLYQEPVCTAGRLVYVAVFWLPT